MRGRGFRQQPSTYKISAAPTGRARCRRCRRRIEKGAARVEICAFVRPGRRTLLLRCADCVDARFAAAVAPPARLVLLLLAPIARTLALSPLARPRPSPEAAP